MEGLYSCWVVSLDLRRTLGAVGRRNDGSDMVLRAVLATRRGVCRARDGNVGVSLHLYVCSRRQQSCQWIRRICSSGSLQ
jgi:hypothetical protein